MIRPHSTFSQNIGEIHDGYPMNQSLHVSNDSNPTIHFGSAVEPMNYIPQHMTQWNKDNTIPQQMTNVKTERDSVGIMTHFLKQPTHPTLTRWLH